MLSVLTAATDAGGANAVIPVLQWLLKKGHARPVCVEHGQLASALRDLDLPVGRVPLVGVRTSVAQLRNAAHKILANYRPDVVIVGTSWGNTIDKELVYAANEHRIPTLAVLDMWSYYRERFASSNGRLDYLPLVVCVMDQVAKKEAVISGIPAGRIRITGNPHFDEIRKKATSDRIRREAQDLRSKWLGERKKIISFASEAIARHFPRRSPRFRGYTEKEVLKDLFEVRGDASLVVKLHPQNKMKDVDFLKNRNNVIYVRRGSFFTCLSASDVVVGMTSMALLEASYFGKPAISYQPHLVRPDSYIGNRLGITWPVYDKLSLRSALDRARPTNPPRRLSKLANGNSAERIGKCVISLAGGNA
jgi:hypothetical protein